MVNPPHNPDAPPRVCVVMNKPLPRAETFIRAQVAGLGGNASVLECRGVRLSGAGFGWWPRAAGPRRLWAYARGRLGISHVQAPALRRYFASQSIDAVVANYAHVAIPVMEGCALAGVPLIVHCHGHDVFRRPVVEAYAPHWPRLFDVAARIIAVSRHAGRELIDRGAPPDKVAHLVYGVDLDRFTPGDPAKAEPVFLAVGRLVPKKSPQRVIAAFAQAAAHLPGAGAGARLTMIGDGPLRESCVALASKLNVASQVTFAGTRSADEVAQAVRGARAYVQHSVVAPDGDAEGTPVSILEACASALPVIATRHMGIKDVIADGETGLLCDEGDVAAMASHMVRLGADADLAARLGRAGAYIEQHHTARHYQQGLMSIIREATAARR